MTGNQQQIEARGSDVETAVRNGLARLGLNRSEVTIEVIDEGSRGLLGIGSREAVVRLTATMTSAPPPPPITIIPPTEPKPVEVPDRDAKIVTDEGIEEGDEEAPIILDEETLLHEQQVAIQIIGELLQKMQVTATVTGQLSAKDDLTGQRINVINIHGNDLGVLIGPRGETLNAIQYIARLMVGHQIKRRTDFIVDVESYRQRREQALARLAEHMATKAAKQQRPISLEPMPPYERRIIHMTLRNSKTVYTQSTGEGKRRKVRIIPK